MNPLIQQIKALDQEILQNQAVFRKAKSEIHAWINQHKLILALVPVVGFGVGLMLSGQWLLKVSTFLKLKAFEFIETQALKILM